MALITRYIARANISKCDKKAKEFDILTKTNFFKNYNYNYKTKFKTDIIAANNIIF